MRKLLRLTVYAALAVALSSCLSSPFKKVGNPNIPFERPGYSILPPAGSGWEYYANEQDGRYKLNFFTKIPDPRFHSLAVGVIETPNSATFESPEEFKKYMKTTIEMAMSPNRLTILDKNIELDDKFGPYTVKYYTKSEDRRAVNRGSEPFLVLVDYGYVFVHPGIPKLIVQVSYSERGRPGEIRPSLKQEAQAFFEGIKISK